MTSVTGTRTRSRFVALRRRPARAVAGQSMVEYLIILPSMMLLLLGAVQFGLLYQIKSQLNYATFAAARQGSLKNGSTLSMKDALAAGMSPLFTSSPDPSGMLRGRLVGTIEVLNPMVTKLDVLNPTTTMVTGFKTQQDPRGTGKMQIPNDNLQYRPTNVTHGGANIQDANILKIRVTYCAKLVVPIANVVFYSLVSGADDLSIMGGKLFQAPNPALPVNTTCKGLQNIYGGKIIGALGTVDQHLGTSMKNEAQSALDSINELLKTNIPLINWNLGGYRIPITAEAVVRMQTPYR